MKHTALQFLENAYDKSGDCTALFDEKRSFTYRELRQTALRIGTYIHEWNASNKPVVVLSERDARCIAMFWGILYSGNFYVPLNYKSNQRIFHRLLQQIRPAGVLCCDDNPKIAELCRSLNIKYGCFEQMNAHPIHDSLYSIRILESSPAYMVFTSGTTGMPKGIVKSHHSIVSFVNSFQETFHFQKKDIFGSQAEFDYDVAAKDIYLTAAASAKLGILPRKCFLMPVKLIEYLSEWNINTLIWAAAAVRLMAQNGCLEKYHKDLKIEKVFFSGEELSQEDLKTWVQFLPNASYVNLYAPSEVTGNCLYYKVDNAHIPKKLPLGVPFDNIEVLVLNENLKPAGENEQGEICVQGPFLSMGYYKDMAQTNEKFIQNPLHSDYIDFLYRTGDIAEYVNHELYFLGRKDYQIKFMGHRIELFEIEAIFSQVSEAEQCCCVMIDSALILFYTGSVDVEKALEKMKRTAPKYKIPQKFVQLAEFPVNDRGKIDRQTLIKKYKEQENETRSTKHSGGYPGKS